MNWFYISALVAICSVAVSLPILGNLDIHLLNCKTQNHIPKLSMDFDKYLGKWYELYHTDTYYFGTDCVCTSADYDMISNNVVSITHNCYKNNELVEKIGKGKIITNTSLEVSFGSSLHTPYDIVYIDENYKYAVVLSCSTIPILGKMNLWIFGRNYDNMGHIEEIFTYLHTIGLGEYTNKLVKTNHNNCPYEKLIDPIVLQSPFISEKIYEKQYNILSQNHYTDCNCRNIMLYKNNTAIFSCNTNYSDVKSVRNNYYILSTTQDHNNMLLLDNTTDFHDIFVLSRDKSISHKIYMEFENILEELGYNTILQTLDTKC